jgi:hypothetical protein
MKSLFVKPCILLALLAFVVVSTAAARPRHHHHQHKAKMMCPDMNEPIKPEVITVNGYETMTIIAPCNSMIGYRVTAFYTALDEAYARADTKHYKILPRDVKLTSHHGEWFVTLMGVKLISVAKWDADANHERLGKLARIWQKNLAVSIPKFQPLNKGKSSAVF